MPWAPCIMSGEASVEKGVATLASWLYDLVREVRRKVVRTIFPQRVYPPVEHLSATSLSTCGATVIVIFIYLAKMTVWLV